MEGGPAEIINSQGLFIFMTGGDGDIIVFNSEVGEIDPREYTGTLFYENSIWYGGYEIFDNSHITIRGNVRMLPTIPIFDESSTLTRTYDVVLREDRYGIPFRNTSLALKHNGTTVWNGFTDTEGRVTFDITFDSNNANDQWILNADTSIIDLNNIISIYISNPVIINLEQIEDSLLYRPVLHVDASNTSFPNGTRESPYPTIQEGIDNSGGAIVYVHAGTYPGDIEPGRTRGGIMLKDSVIVMGAGADSTILTGAVNAEGAKGGGIIRFQIEDGIHAIGSSLSLHNSVVSGFNGNAVWGTKTDFYLINNIFAGNNQDAIFLHDSSTALIKNNIIVNNTGFGINGVESAIAVIDYNDVWNNLENYHEFLPAGPHDISEDPLFIDYEDGDFHLQSGSPGIDAGDPDPVFNDPDGSRNDMGAFGGFLGSSQMNGLDKEEINFSSQDKIFQCYPNPFEHYTTIQFQLPKEGWVNLSVYNLTGQKIKTIINGRRVAGSYRISWDGTDETGTRLKTGVCFLQLTTPEFQLIRKSIIL
jgi:parallel beta-helix repeat protein